MRKLLTSLQLSDFTQHPVWYIPHESCDEDYVTIPDPIVEPASLSIVKDPHARLVLSVRFFSANGEEFPGCVHWLPSRSERKMYSTDPVLFRGGMKVHFWRGEGKPELDNLPKFAFPLTARSVEIMGFPPIEILVPGYGYYERDAIEISLSGDGSIVKKTGMDCIRYISS